MDDIYLHTTLACLNHVLSSPAGEFAGEPEPLANEFQNHGFQEARFLEPVGLVFAAAGLTYLTRVVDGWLAGKGQGVQIDMRSTPPVVTNIAGIPNGYLIIIKPDGSVSNEKTTSSSLDSILSVAQALRK